MSDPPQTSSVVCPTRLKSPRQAFAWGCGAALAGFLLVLPWIYVVVHVHGHAAAAIAATSAVIAGADAPRGFCPE